MPDPIRPSLVNRERLLALCLLLVVCLILPLLVTLGSSQGRRGLYRAVPDGAGPYPAMERQIFEEKGDIDILFLGDSLLWVAIDPALVQAALSKQLGRPARVLAFSGNWAGLDRHDVLVRDLLARRKVGMVVFAMPTQLHGGDQPHVQAFRWLSFGDDPDLFRGLSLFDRASLYSVMMLGAPRQLLARVRPNAVAPASTDPALLMGVATAWGFMGAPFVREPDPVLAPEQTPLVYGPASRAGFRFTGPRLGSLQRHFAQRLAGQLRQHGVRGVVVHVPRYGERQAATVDERECWAETLDPALTLIGVPPRSLFPGMTDLQIQRYYYNEHLNENGKRLFTRALLPTLGRLYAETQRQP